MTDLRLNTRGRPRLFGPRRRWLALGVWLVLLVGIVVVQYRAVRPYVRTRSLAGDDTPATRVELLWRYVPRVLLVSVSVGLFLWAKRLVPEDGTRSMIRAWGCFATFVALLCSFVIPTWLKIVFTRWE